MATIVLENPIAFDAANGMLDTHTNTRNQAISHLVRVASGFSSDKRSLQGSSLGDHTGYMNCQQILIISIDRQYSVPLRRQGFACYVSGEQRVARQ